MLPVDVAGLVQSLPECSDHVRVRGTCAAAETAVGSGPPHAHPATSCSRKTYGLQAQSVRAAPIRMEMSIEEIGECLSLSARFRTLRS